MRSLTPAIVKCQPRSKSKRTDIDLRAGNVKGAAVERETLGEPGHRVLGRGVRGGHGARRVRGEGAVIDDAACVQLRCG